MHSIITLGYEKASLDDFIATLQTAGVTTLLDVRERPISRRKGFSKTALSNAAQSNGIEYLHAKELGSPSELRNELYKTKDYSSFFKLFDLYLETQHELLSKLAVELDGIVALVCYERDPNTCHRKSVARELGKIVGITPKHLGVKHGLAEDKKEAVLYPRQSLSAA